VLNNLQNITVTKIDSMVLSQQPN